MKTLKQALAGAVLKAVLCTGAVTASFFLVSNMAPAEVTGQTQVHVEPATGSPADLVAKHHCWTGEAPADMAGKMPGHVVFAKGSTPAFAGPRMVNQALEQIFNGVDHGITVYGFCR
jgi:hypothetical protein